MKESAIIFIDGSNFHYAIKRIGVPAERIDYGKLSRLLVQGREWLETRYYIGEVLPEGNMEIYEKQQEFLQLLRRQEGVSVHLGRVECRPAKRSAKMLRNRLNKMSRENNSLDGKAIAELGDIADIVSADQYIEKGVDVMMAVDMVTMAYEKKYDIVYLLTADVDFRHAVKKVREYGKKVFVVTTNWGQLGQTADVHVKLKKSKLMDCLL